MKTDPQNDPAGARLVDGLRQELHQYGEVLALLDRQQAAVMDRAADPVLQSSLDLQEQMAALQTARLTRERAQQEAARALQLPAEAPFTALLPRLSEKHRPAVEALVRENNQLLVRIQQRARQNHILLSRSLELMQDFIGALVPAGPAKTYTEEGALAPAQPPGRSLYEAVG